ncbi:MAG: GNAT family N-acetyltransferase [Gordonia sp. (in: high G+C Gram-positive bacteria)]
MTDPTPQPHQCRAVDLGAATLYGLLRLRVEVFVVEQACPYPEIDGRDLEPDARHFWFATDDGTIMATLRLLTDPPGPDGTPRLRIGRVCTARAHRGSGLAARLLTAALAEVGAHECHIDAQTYLRSMYESFGFRAVGTEYLEDGLPHIAMVRLPPSP